MPTSISQKVITGAIWYVAMRWSMRGLGLISTAILARLLTPADFGLVAIALAVTGLMEALSSIGIETAIVRHKDPQRKHFDTIWTINLLLHVVLALIILALAQPLSVFYEDERFFGIFLVLSASTLISGAKNIGVADLQRNFKFNKEFSYNVTSQLLATIATIALAFAYRSYTALILGVLARTFFQVGLSYVVSPYRPGFCLSARSEMLSFSIWQSIRSTSVYFFNNGQRLILGAYFPAATVGLFSLSTDLSRTMVGEVVAPLSRALLPGLSKIQEEEGWIPRTLPRVINITASLSLALGVGLSAVANDAVTLILGPKYLEAIPLVQILALVVATRGFVAPMNTYFIVARMEKQLAIITIYEMIIALSLLFYVCNAGMDIVAVAIVNGLVATLLLLRIVWLFRKFPGISATAVTVSAMRPAISSAVMYLAVIQVSGILSGANLLLRLGASVTAGATTYILCAIMIWMIVGKPAGIEREILARLAFRRQASGV